MHPIFSAQPKYKLKRTATFEEGARISMPFIQQSAPPVELEGIGTITMGSILVKILRQIDDLDGFKRTFLKITTVALTNGRVRNPARPSLPTSNETSAGLWIVTCWDIANNHWFC